MENRNLLKKFWEDHNAKICVILVAVATRLIPHFPNMTPIGAIALFSGSSLKGIKRFILPLVIMLLSDIIIGLHSTMGYVYGSFIVITLMGQWISSKSSLLKIMSIAIASSLVFFTITNFGVWMNSSMYPKTIYGLYMSYILGVPFLRNTLLGDLLYTPLLIYGYRFLESLQKKEIINRSHMD